MMAINRSDRYPGRFEASTIGSPLGRFKNRTAPGAKDGSYLEKDWAEDMDALRASILDAAGVVPNNVVDQVGASQAFDALVVVIDGAITDRVGTVAGTIMAGDDSRVDGAVTQWQSGKLYQVDYWSLYQGKPYRCDTPNLSSAVNPLVDVGNWEPIIKTVVGPSETATMSQKAITDQLLGVDKSWVDVSASRANNTTYTNTSGRPISIAVSMDSTALNQFLKLTIDGSLTITGTNGQTAGASSFVTAIIPDGATYHLLMGSFSSIINWLEL